MTTTALTVGPTTTLIEDQVYALPAVLIFITSTLALESSLDGSTWVAVTDANTTGTLLNSVFVRAPGGNAIVVCRAAQVQFNVDQIPTGSLLQVAGLGVGIPAVADAIIGNNAQSIYGFDIYANIFGAGGGIVTVDGSGNFSAGSGSVTISASGAVSLGSSLTIPSLTAPTGEIYQLVISDVGLVTSAATPSATILPGIAIGDATEVDDTITFGSGGALITRDSGDITISTTTSGKIIATADDEIELTSGTNKSISLTSGGEILLNPNLADAFPVSIGSGATDSTSPAFRITIPGVTSITAATFENLNDTGNNDFIQLHFITRDGPSSILHGTFELQSSGVQDSQGWFGINFDPLFGNADIIRFMSDGTIDAAGYIVGAAVGISTTITTGSLVGKTITITKGIITGFA